MLTFDEALHQYKYNGKIVPSVTQILSNVGTRHAETNEWKPVGSSDFCHNETASDFGTAFHTVAEYMVQGIECDYDPQMEPWIVQLRKFLDEWKLVPIAVEKRMYSKLGYAGTVDFFGRTDKFPAEVIIDWKTSTSFQKYWRNQTAAYENAIKEETKIKRAIPRVSVQFLQDSYKVDIRISTKNPEDFIR